MFWAARGADVFRRVSKNRRDIKRAIGMFQTTGAGKRWVNMYTANPSAPKYSYAPRPMTRFAKNPENIIRMDKIALPPPSRVGKIARGTLGVVGTAAGVAAVGYAVHTRKREKFYTHYYDY